jgi:hypothetical protein
MVLLWTAVVREREERREGYIDSEARAEGCPKQSQIADGTVGVAGQIGSGEERVRRDR